MFYDGLIWNESINSYYPFFLVILTESPPLVGGRNLIGGTRIDSRKNIEWPAFFPNP